jgi:sugar lactone lactonase YvrE
MKPLVVGAVTLAGCSVNGTDDGPRDAARFANPTNVVILPNSDVIVADFDNHRIRAISPDGTTTTLIARDDFKRPFGLALAPDGTLYVETDDNDLGEHTEETGTLWRVNLISRVATVVARDLGRPRGLVVLPDGRIAMADHMRHTVSLLDPSTGIATVLAGTAGAAGHANGVGADARFAQPYDVAILPGGDLVVTDMDNHRLRRVTLAGEVSDFSGSGEKGTIDGASVIARYDGPQGVARAPDGTLYVTDVRAHYVRRIATNGVVTTVAGDGTSGFVDADQPRQARFYGLEGIDASATQVVVSDGNIGDGMPFHRVRRIDVAAFP